MIKQLPLCGHIPQIVGNATSIFEAFKEHPSIGKILKAHDGEAVFVGVSSQPDEPELTFSLGALGSGWGGRNEHANKLRSRLRLLAFAEKKNTSRECQFSQRSDVQDEPGAIRGFGYMYGAAGFPGLGEIDELFALSLAVSLFDVSERTVRHALAMRTENLIPTSAILYLPNQLVVQEFETAAA